MSTTSTSILSMLTEPAFTGGLLLAYNAFMGQGVTRASLTDAAYLAVANLFSNTLVTLFFSPSSTVSTIFGTQQNAQMIEQTIIVPVLTSLMYSYAYDNYYRKTYNQVTNRTNNTNYILSFASSWVSNAYSGSIYSLLTMSTS